MLKEFDCSVCLDDVDFDLIDKRYLDILIGMLTSDFVFNYDLVSRYYELGKKHVFVEYNHLSIHILMEYYYLFHLLGLFGVCFSHDLVTMYKISLMVSEWVDGGTYEIKIN